MDSYDLSGQNAYAQDEHMPAVLQKSDEAYRTISEVADELHVPQHRLRSWETAFPGVKPFRGEGGRRYYRPQDVDLLRQISHFLYVDRLSHAETLAHLHSLAQVGRSSSEGVAARDDHNEQAVEVVVERLPMPVTLPTDHDLQARELHDAVLPVEPEVHAVTVDPRDEQLLRIQAENTLLKAELVEILDELKRLRKLLPV